jgi:flagellar basal-body rod protein FlgG
MLKGLYTSYSGLINEQNRLDVLTNNLANATTNGYKAEGATSQTFSDVLAFKIKDQSEGYQTARYLGVNTPGVKIGETYTDYSQGSFQATGNVFDLGLSGDGFFNVSFTNKAGETSTMYTRDGSFTINKDGYLVTKDGDFLLGENGQIQVDPLKTTEISQAGVVTQDGVVVDTIQLTDFEDYNYLEHYGENYFSPVEGAEFAEASAKIFSGYLETSNVSVVEEMVEMISVTRQYEANQKIMQTMDNTLDVSVNQLGKL